MARLLGPDLREADDFPRQVDPQNLSSVAGVVRYDDGPTRLEHHDTVGPVADADDGSTFQSLLFVLFHLGDKVGFLDRKDYES
jgi:hypothetical protein